MAWADKTQARAHWADAKSLPDTTLDTLLDVATEQCAEYAPALARLADASMVLGSPVVTAVNGSLFTAKDVGSAVVGNGIAVDTTVLSVSPDGATATLSVAATVTVTLSSLGLTKAVPSRYMLATVYQAREVYAASTRGESDIIGVGDFAIRARPMTAAVKSLLRPPPGVPAVG